MQVELSGTARMAPESHDTFLFLTSLAFLTLKRQTSISRHLLSALEDGVRMVFFLIFFFFLPSCFFAGEGKGTAGLFRNRRHYKLKIAFTLICMAALF